MKVPTSGLNLFSTILLYGLSFMAVSSTKLSIVTNGEHIIHLYERMKNEDPPLARDPALDGPRIRKKICKNITNSGFFYWEKPVKMTQRIFSKLQQPRYDNIFNQIYTRKRASDHVQHSLHHYKYTNPYRLGQFHIMNSFHPDFTTRTLNTTEHAFICLIEDSQGNIIPLYISKEYNLYGDGVYVAGRFLFQKPYNQQFGQYYEIFLAEEPSVGIGNSTFNLELYYLGIRRYRQPATDPQDDPVCQLASWDQSKNQSYRLCAEIYGSNYFKKKMRYPVIQSLPHDCIERDISFLTNAAIQEAGRNTYKEFMIPCETKVKRTNKRRTYYISRAYRPHQVFVYRYVQVGGTRKLVLKNQSINVHSVDELLGFDDVE